MQAAASSALVLTDDLLVLREIEGVELRAS